MSLLSRFPFTFLLLLCLIHGSLEIVSERKRREEEGAGPVLCFHPLRPFRRRERKRLVASNGSSSFFPFLYPDGQKWRLCPSSILHPPSLPAPPFFKVEIKGPIWGQCQPVKKGKRNWPACPFPFCSACSRSCKLFSRSLPQYILFSVAPSDSCCHNLTPLPIFSLDIGERSKSCLYRLPPPPRGPLAPITISFFHAKPREGKRRCF